MISKIVAQLLLPPANLLLLGLFGAILTRWWRTLGFALMALAVLALYLLSIPVVASRLLSALEPAAAVDLSQPAQAIVILGGGLYANAPEYGGETINATSLERVRYGARLYRETQLPITVTGGVLMRGQRASEGALMEKSLREDFRVPVRWVEGQAHTTEQNAVLTARMLRPLGISRVYLVTHAWHMPRAMRSFSAAGFQPIAAPTGFTTSFRGDIRGFIPDAKSLQKSYFAMHEVIGLLWYRLKQPFRPDLADEAPTALKEKA